MNIGQAPPFIKHPVRPRRCNEIRDVRGSIPYQIGIIAKQPGDNWQSNNMRREQRKIEEITRKNSEHLKDAFQHVARHQFDQTTEKKIMLRNLRHKVDVGLEAASRDLDIRRDKLRRMLLEEEDSLMKEYVDKAQKVNEKKLEEIKLRTQEIRNKREAERKKIVQEKRLQQYTERCEHIRSILSKRMLEEVKKGQQYQMKEREYLKEQEREAEKMWAEVAKKEYEAKIMNFGTRYVQLHTATRLSCIAHASILTDNKLWNQTPKQLFYQHTPSSQTAEITKMLSQLISLNKRIVFQWISSHCGIMENENADALAKKGSTTPYRPVTKSTYYSVKRLIKSTYLDFNKQNLITQSQGKKWNSLHHNPQLIPDLPRKSSVAAFRLATGHDCLAKHLHRIGIYQSPICPLCDSDQEMDSQHLKICASVAGHDNIFKKHWSARGQMTLLSNAWH
ncbi:hypothetical protein ANN_23313 [Periplaneta americana]|uniref:RNase H type-1 domain-containing protein n=1 Tax=Periplaneta americana TaxID=6978 RepID=A0ABQ8SKR7_PERAM|nr:hypothetical protein ANN_23313 [Periplaneta americana]